MQRWMDAYIGRYGMPRTITVDIRAGWDWSYNGWATTSFKMVGENHNGGRARDASRGNVYLRRSPQDEGIPRNTSKLLCLDRLNDRTAVEGRYRTSISPQFAIIQPHSEYSTDATYRRAGYFLRTEHIFGHRV